MILVNAEIEFKNMNSYIKNTEIKLLGSCRMPYDYYTAGRSGADIITMSGSMI